MKLDERKHGVDVNYWPPEPSKKEVARNPDLKVHQGYSPIVGNRAMGRFKYYEVALKVSPFVVRFEDLKKFGFKRGKNLLVSKAAA